MATRTALILLAALLALSGCLKPFGLEPQEPPTPLSHHAALLWDAPYDTITVEVDHAPGYVPTDLALAALRTTLLDVTGKAVSIVGPKPIPAQSGNYTGADVLRIHAATFDHPGPGFGSNGTATLHVLYLDGRAADQDGDGLPDWQGIYVQQGDQAAIALTPDIWKSEYPDPLGDLLGEPGREFDARFERAVLIHEVGHALGLVGTIPEITGREDPASPGHSVQPDSVMHSGLVEPDEDLIVALREQGIEPVYEFDEHDLADLRAFRQAGA